MSLHVDITSWSEIRLIMFFAAKDGEALELTHWKRP